MPCGLKDFQHFLDRAAERGPVAVNQDRTLDETRLGGHGGEDLVIAGFRGKLEFLRQRAEGTEMPATNSVRNSEKTQYFSLDEYGGDLEHGAADELSWRCAF